MKVNVLDIFYNHIIPEASEGRIDCNFYYNMVFSTSIVENDDFVQSNNLSDNLLIPTLLIKDKELFDRLLVEYVDLAMQFYKDCDWDTDILDYKMLDNKMICQEKVIMALLFANATVEDFNNPCEYLRKRINFIKNDIRGVYDLGYSDILKGDLTIEIDKDIVNNETPYQMIISAFSNEGEKFEFPRIKLGISDGVVYIYAIQNKLNENNRYSKKINRILYKIGEGYVEEDPMIEGESLKDVTSSFLVALNICISFLSKYEYNNIVVPSCLIERWNAKSIANSLKIKHKNLSVNEAEILHNEQNYLQENLTNKLIRTFLRLGCHLNNIEIMSFPYELDSCLHMVVNDKNIKCNNSLLYETHMIAKNDINSKHIK